MGDSPPLSTPKREKHEDKRERSKITRRKKPPCPSPRRLLSRGPEVFKIKSKGERQKNNPEEKASVSSPLNDSIRGPQYFKTKDKRLKKRAKLTIDDHQTSG